MSDILKENAKIQRTGKTPRNTTPSFKEILYNILCTS